MELQVLETKGISCDHVLSIRAGTTRRQIPVSHDQPLCFPTPPENANSLKIDVMAPVGSCRAQMKPKDAEYTINLNPVNKGDADMSIRFAVKEAPQHSHSNSGKPNTDVRSVGGHATSPMKSPGAKGRLDAALVAREYLDEHNLFFKVQEMLAHVINEKPENPYDYMMDYLATQKQKMTKAKTPQAPNKEATPCPVDPAEAVKAKLGSGFIHAAKSGELSSALQQARPAPKPARASEEAVKAKLQLGLTQAMKSGDLSSAFAANAEKREIEESAKAKLQVGLTQALKSGDLSKAFAASHRP